MVSPTQWTWVLVNSVSWWWTGRPGVLLFMVSQRIRHDWKTELTSSQSFSGDQSFCLPICLCLSEFKCINYLLWSWRGDLVGGASLYSLYHSQQGLGVGVGLDLMDHKSHLSLGCASTYGWEVHWYQVWSQMWGRDFLFLSGFHCPIVGRVVSQISGAMPWMSGQIWLCCLNYVCSHLPTLQPYHRGTRGACSG